MAEEKVLIYLYLMRDLIEIRKQKNISQNEMSQRLKRARSYVFNLEKSMNPRLQDIEAYAEALGFEIQYYLKDL